MKEWIYNKLVEEQKECEFEDSRFCGLIHLKSDYENLETISFIEKSGVLFTFGLSFFAVVLIILAVLFIIGKKSGKVQMIYFKVKQTIFWNAFIRYVF